MICRKNKGKVAIPVDWDLIWPGRRGEATKQKRLWVTFMLGAAGGA